MNYRAATTEDSAAICELWATCGLGHGDDTDHDELVERLTSDDGFFIVGTDTDGRIVSSAMGCYDDHRGWMKRVVVAPAHQGTGEGSRLIAELERRFLAAGITQLRLAVFLSLIHI